LETAKMADDIIAPFEKTRDYALSRRGFAAVSLSAGALAAGATVAADAPVDESDVVIKTADGNCDAALFHPAGKGRWPGVVMFTDILGLRPAFRDMGRRLAAQGYTVVVPNPFYRTRQAPVLDGPFDFSKDMAKLAPLLAPLTGDAKTRDVTTYVAYLDTLAAVKTHAKIGVCGYCMGGPYTLMAAAAAPTRVGAGGSFHGGGLVTATPDSPHLLIAKIKASYYFGIANNDDQRQPDAKDKLRAAFDQAHLPATIEVYADCQHGWCVPDGAVYNKAEADRAFGDLVALFAKALV
jgi:carboxymethylenebutenolidase